MCLLRIKSERSILASHSSCIIGNRYQSLRVWPSKRARRLVESAIFEYATSCYPLQDFRPSVQILPYIRCFVLSNAMMIFNAICSTQSLLSKKTFAPIKSLACFIILCIHKKILPMKITLQGWQRKRTVTMQSGDKRGCSNVRDKNVGASGVKSQQMLWRKFARLIS